MKKLSKDHSLEENSRVVHISKKPLCVPLLITLKEQESVSK